MRIFFFTTAIALAVPTMADAQSCYTNDFGYCHASTLGSLDSTCSQSCAVAHPSGHRYPRHHHPRLMKPNSNENPNNQ